MRALTLLCLCLLGVGCAPLKRLDFVPKDQLAFDAKKYPDDAALVLYRADRTELVDEGSESFTRSLRHQVFAVLGEGGFSLAEVRVPFPKTWKLLHFNARLVQPDGSEQHFDGASMLTDSGGKKDQDRDAKFFRFPDVRVGSVLEYAWQVEAPYFWNADDQDTLGVFPVRRYEFELTAPRPLVMETISFNHGAPIDVRSLADGRKQLRFELSDLPPRRDADYAPHWTFTEPRWAWRVLAYKLRGFSADWLRSWEDVVEGRGKQFYVEGELQQGLALTLDVGGCADVACKVSRARALLASKTTTAGVTWNRQEPLAAAFASGRTSVVERALLLRHLLGQQGLDAWLAYGTGRYSQQTSPTFPRLAQFDHLFVHLPVQPGVARATTIDPSCDACGPGQLPEQFVRTPVFVFKTEPELGQVRTTGRWVNALEDAPPAQLVMKHQVTLEPTGTLSDVVSVRYRGPPADPVREWRRAQTAQRHLDAELDVARRLSPIATVKKVTWGACEAGDCGWETQLELPVEATADGPRWLVPTTMLRPSWEGVFESPSRALDAHFNEPLDIEEVAELTVPEGLQLVEVPPPTRHRVDGLAVEVTFERTPTGARVRRSFEMEVCAVPRGEYPKLRALVEAFNRGRREVLVFAPTP